MPNKGLSQFISNSLLQSRSHPCSRWRGLDLGLLGFRECEMDKSSQVDIRKTTRNRPDLFNTSSVHRWRLPTILGIWYPHFRQHPKRTWDVPEETASGSIRDLLGLAAIAPSHASPTRVSQALYLFVQLLKFFVALHSLRFFLRVVATQLFKDFFDGEFVYFSHRDLLCGYAARSDWAAPSSQPS
jgi:hypothetical protein